MQHGYPQYVDIGLHPAAPPLPYLSSRGLFAPFAAVVPQHHEPHVLEFAPSAPQAAPPIPRGPPTKPKRTGYALWVGNLPPRTDLSELKDFFSNGCPLIQSVFLIERSTCAFVNYRTERACRDAQVKFHSSKFRGKILVCRLRIDPEASQGELPSPSLSPSSDVESCLHRTAEEVKEPVIVASRVSSDRNATATTQPRRVRARYFVLKSFTLEDLHAAVKCNTWSTQLHNEPVLDQAYREADNVYLVFSANKSGEYFGYARMSSPMFTKDNSQPANDVHDSNGQKGLWGQSRVISTPATPTAPRGQITDDAARGTLFWEAGASDNEETIALPRKYRKQGGGSGCEPSRIFQIQWVSTQRVPFSMTRGLRNPLNGNREVKVARDGTEIDPAIGRCLIDLFSKVPVADMQFVGLNGERRWRRGP